MSSHNRPTNKPSKGQCQNLTPLLGEARSGSDRQHLSHNTMLFKCLLQSAGSVAPIMSFLTIFQLASCLAGVLPGLVDRTVPLASGCVLLQLKSAQALATLLSRGTFFLGKVAVRALSPSNMRTVHGHIAGIPESQILMELQTSLSFKPAIPISDILITNLERVEPYRPAPAGFPRLVKISFLTSIPVPNKKFVPALSHLPVVSIARALDI
ncbi:hypothetical protein DPMN_100439 [Dreissena polymorpha]|uniref:Uncharacterized protein n=1 Tax=Dreissena polymorpha TaxID=45954 RepID=A0A9D4LHB8_DREPO|nr:hypothetical protein DPMN_100439 [Dreissena polymorpha]